VIGAEDDEAYATRLQREAIAKAGNAEDGQLYTEVEAEMRAEYAAAGRSDAPTPKEIQKRLKGKRKELRRIRREAIERARVAQEEAEEAAWEEEQTMQVLSGLGDAAAAKADGFSGAVSLKAERAHTLTAANVVASSGQPERSREVQCYAQLRPGAYTVLVAAYQRGMEGPFTLTLRANYSVELHGLWPPSRDPNATHEYASKSPIVRLGKWIRGTVSGLRERLVGVDPVELAAKQEEESSAEQALRAMEEAAEEAEVAMAAGKAEAATVWVEQVDPVTGRSYWYNGETGESQFGVPHEVRVARGEVEEEAAAAKAMSGKGVKSLLADSLTMQRARKRQEGHEDAATKEEDADAADAGVDAAGVGDGIATPAADEAAAPAAPAADEAADVAAAAAPAADEAAAPAPAAADVAADETAPSADGAVAGDA
jgi:hypothetical protein